MLNPRRHPPVLRPTLRNGRPNMNYQLFRDDETQTDVINDDLAILHLQYSTQWDSLAHVGQLFDADGDGMPEPVYYNGYRARHRHRRARPTRRTPAPSASVPAHGPPPRRKAAGHREHGGEAACRAAA